MSDPLVFERIKDAERRQVAQERANDELKAKIREIRDIMARFGLKERAKGEYVIDFKVLVATLGAEQAMELAAELQLSWRPPVVEEPRKRGRPRKVAP